MKVRVWGARGSVPAPGPEMNRYGGNTSCVAGDPRQRRAADPRRRHRHPHPRPRASRPRPTINILLTHLHLDHIQGLMFFPPCFRADAEITIWGPASPEALARGPDRPLHLGAPVAGRGSRAALLGLVPRHARRASGEIGVGDDPRARRSPTAARRSATGSPRATRPSATSPTTSRSSATALAERRAGVDLRLRPGPRRRPPDPRLPVHRRRVPGPRRLGPLGDERRAHLRPRVGARRLLLFHHDPLHTDDFLDGLHADGAASAGRRSAATRRSSRWRWRGASFTVEPAHGHRSRGSRLRRSLSAFDNRYNDPGQSLDSGPTTY